MNGISQSPRPKGRSLESKDNELSFISKRYVALNEEMRRREYSPNPIPLEILEEGIDRRMFHDYNPTLAALEISRQRIKERNEK